MPRPSLTLLACALSAALPNVLAQTLCNATKSCPETAPCCSPFGYCGEGSSFCLGGCEPLYSFSPTSCKPNPICESITTTFTDLSRVQQDSTKWNGNASEYDWIVNTGHLIPGTGGVRLTLNESNSGTKISSTRYVHYGKIEFVLETSKWPGVVSAAITMSDVKDEIDWEWTGSNNTQAQTNFWFMGIANYSDSQGLSVGVNSDTSQNFHTYTFDWQENYINWMIDGNVVRSVNKKDTVASDGVTYKFPSTPSQIQISIWPAGVNSSAPGTIEWAGGYINWQDPDYTSNGYFWNTIQSVAITCADDPSQSSNTTGWAYSDLKTGQMIPDVYDTSASLIIGAAERVVPYVSLGGLAGLSLVLGASLLSI